MQPGSYAPPPPPGVPSEQVKPSKWWFLAAGLIAVGGIVLAVIWFVVGFMNFLDKIDEFQRVDVPGTSDIVIDDPGGYSVYHEYPGASDDNFGSPFVSSPNITITDPSGDDVTLRPYTSDVTYSGSGYEGVAILTFDADEAGTYTVETEGDSSTEVAIGPGLGRDIVGMVVGGFVVGGTGVLVGGIMAIVVGVRRSQNRRSLTGPVVPPGPPGGWGGAYPQYGQAPGYGGYGPGPGGPGYGPPPSAPGYGSPSGQGYGPPPAPGYGTPSGQGYGPPPAPGYGTPPAAPDYGSPPAAPPAPPAASPPQDSPPQDAPPKDAPSGPYPPPSAPG